MTISAHDGTAYRTATAISVWDGVAWRVASAVWVWDGSAWQQGLTAAPPPTLDAPSIVADWDFGGHDMVITIAAGANNPDDTIYVVSATGSGTGGMRTGPGTIIDAVQPEDGTQSCYTAIATHADWTSSDPSTESCATRGNVQ